MISVIVPVYNTEKFLDECIQSILAQTFTDFELLLIDDGSMDSSGVICDKYAADDSRVKVFHKENGGVTSARRLGVEQSKGDFVLFVDSDDTITNTALHSLTIAIDDNVDIILTRIKTEKIESSDISAIEFIKKTLVGEIAKGVPARLYRRILFEKDTLSLTREIFVGEDEIMNLMVGKNARTIRIINESIYYYRHNLESVTSTRKFSLEYEEMLMDALKRSLGNDWSEFANELAVRNLLTLENLIICKIKVPYNRPWVIDLKEWSKGQRLSFRYWCTLNIRHNLLCKYILAIEKRIKRLFK
ncbi:MAG: glycosyltransferase [Alistipes sp.]|nr:glycosyltransferase [Alistipes sp.]